MQVFFSDGDYCNYIRILAHKARRHSLAVWTYCLMPNHVHLIVVPSSEQGLSRPFGEAHNQYAREVNRQHGWTGHLWQERFASFPMDEPHLLAAIRYVLLNPVRAGLARTATDWPYSSARAHILGEPDELADYAPCSHLISDWDSYLEQAGPHLEETEAVRRHGRIGRPLGSKSFIDELEIITQRRLRPKKAGRRPKKK